MFKLLGRKREAKGAGNKPREESRGGEVTEDKGNADPPVAQANSLVAESGVSASASARSILKAAISSAEQIVGSVKTQVIAEAREEAARIIAEAEKEAEKITGEKKPAQKKTAEGIASIAETVAEEKVAEPALVPEEAVAETEEPEPSEGWVAEPVAEEVKSLQETSAIAEPVAELIEPQKAGKKREAVAKEAPEVVLTKEESQAMYTGEVELNVGLPIEPTMVAKLYNFLQTTPEIKFVRTAGSWNKGSTITIMMDKPVALLAMLITKLPEAKVLPERPEVKDHVRDRRGVRRINISLRNQ